MPTRSEMLETFVRQRPQDPFPKYALALEHKNGGDLARAWEAFAALIAAHPTYTATYLHAGNTLVGLGRTAEAKQVYQQGEVACQQAGDSHALGELQGALAALGG